MYPPEESSKADSPIIIKGFFALLKSLLKMCFSSIISLIV